MTRTKASTVCRGNIYAFDNLREVTRADDFPLSICYRCPKSHIDLARAIVPHIEARENAPDGVVDTIRENALDRFVRPG